MLKTGDKVMVIDSNVEHLKDLVGKSGVVASWISKYGVVRYKVIFESEDQAYFRKDELKVI